MNQILAVHQVSRIDTTACLAPMSKGSVELHDLEDSEPVYTNTNIKTNKTQSNLKPHIYYGKKESYAVTMISHLHLTILLYINIPKLKNKFNVSYFFYYYYIIIFSSMHT
jgi:hypothetical protein